MAESLGPHLPTIFSPWRSDLSRSVPSADNENLVSGLLSGSIDFDPNILSSLESFPFELVWKYEEMLRQYLDANPELLADPEGLWGVIKSVIDIPAGERELESLSRIVNTNAKPK